MREVSVRLTVNGQARDATVEPRVTLADFLREQCHLTGTHLGCEHGVCGACTVLVDGAAVRSCLVFAVQADGAEVTTIEGIGAPDGELSHGAGGVPRLPRAAVRLLHAGLRRVGDRVPARPPEPDRRRRSARRCPATSAAAPATRASSPRCARPPTRVAGSAVMTQPAPRARPGTSARASTASRTRGCSPATAPTSTTSRCRGCCTRASCAARSPAPRSAGSTRRPRSRVPGVRFVFTAADLNPGVKEQWHTSIGAASPETPRPPLAEGEVRFVGDPVALVVADEPRTSPRTRPSSSTSTTSRCPPSSTTPTAEHADALVHESHGSNVIGELTGLPASALDDVFAAAAHVVTRDDLPAGVRAGADGGARPRRRLLARDGRADDLRGDAVAARGAPLLLPPARDARAPHPRRHARHRRRLRAEGHGPARRDVPDARGAEGRRAGEVGRGPPREPARRRASRATSTPP